MTVSTVTYLDEARRQRRDLEDELAAARQTLDDRAALIAIAWQRLQDTQDEADDLRERLARAESRLRSRWLALTWPMTLAALAGGFAGVVALRAVGL